MAGFDIYFDALEDCASKAKGVANQFRAIADRTPPTTAGGTFGSLDERSAALTKLVNDLDKKVDAEMGHAYQNLDKVETAIDTVVANVKKADLPVPTRAEQV
ncbi:MULTISPECIES: hypothetical protein [unclassified Nonomuraea]|uniref:hypothetical protein n=1 Tax=Nonomuraea sp. NPDC003804 TaxID=3154547 RepID=UPI0033B02FAA